MAASLFFYDLETTGVNPRASRIMQFAGQRTDMKLKPIGEPVNIFVKLSDDIVPDPDAIMITGITPQQANAEGVTEAEFLKIFWEEVATPDTIFVGYNSVRFDDEFMRFLQYRNFYDPYVWQWQDGRSRWDLLDVVRMTRALRPDGIEWPFDSAGKPTNRLEFLTKVNKLDHSNAHDALSDVNATIAVARLIYNKQQKLFEYLLSVRTKQKVAELVDGGEPFVYSSGKYASEFEKTTVAIKVTDNPSKQGILVYDLRHDPTEYIDKTPEELAELWRYKKDPSEPRLPVKTMQFNRCPAVAPLGVLDAASQERLQLDPKIVKANLAKLRKAKDFAGKLQKAVELMNEQRQTELVSSEVDVDAQLYDGFLDRADQVVMSAIRAAQPNDMNMFVDKLQDPRLKALLPLYKARNFPKSLTAEERAAWEAFRTSQLTKGGEKSNLARFFARLDELTKSGHLTKNQEYLIEELRLYGESLMPDPDFAG